MKNPFGLLRFFCNAMNFVAGVALTVMMSLTVIDVLLRAASLPFVGTFEIVSLLMGIVVSFGIPQVSLDKGHVSMEFLTEKLSLRNKNLLNTFTRILCILLFAFIGYNMIKIGARFHASGEVSPTIMIPFYPLPYAVSVCCLLECFVFVSEVVTIWRGAHE
ncbi:MAG TPA: TRAP transporter small permease [Syntrophorhabdaceae bacterium]|nr:TRAP transporter small permease [Syntrophorhabdaceae bacterium]